MPTQALANALFEPKTVALIGASSDISKPSGRPLKYLIKHGFAGSIYPINRQAKTILGLACFEDISLVPAPVDHAFIMLSNEEIPKILRSCAEVGTKCATILASGYAETGVQGNIRQTEITVLAQSLGIRLLGPNSIGLINTDIGLALSANAILELPNIKPGNTAVISQSGSLLGAILSHGEAQNLGYSKLVSVGNEADLTVGDIGEMLIEDDKTDSILLFLETLRDYKKIASFASKAHHAGKPIITYRVGRSKIGQELARTHTGAVISTNKIISTFLTHHGIAEVNMFDSLIEAPRLFVQTKKQNWTRQGTVGIVTTTGGGGTMLVDNLAINKVAIAKPSLTIVKRLHEAGIKNNSEYMIDLTMAGAKPNLIYQIINDLLDDPLVDAVIMVIGSSARFYPDIAVKPLLIQPQRSKILAAYLVPDAKESLHTLSTAGIPVFRSPEVCADAIKSFLNWQRPKESEQAGQKKVLHLKKADNKNANLSELESLEIFSRLGIKIAESKLVSNIGQAVEYAKVIGFPVALKIASKDIMHKTEVGGVYLDIKDINSLKIAFQKISDNSIINSEKYQNEGVIVQKIKRGVAEVLIGYKSDPVVGPVVVLGVGGIFTELYDDSCIRLAPISTEEAEIMIKEVKGLKPILGYRNLPRGDITALASAITSISSLAFEQDIAEAEINPLIVGTEGTGVTAVDGLILKNIEHK